MTKNSVYFDVKELPLGVTITGRKVDSVVPPTRYLELQEDVDAEITDFGKAFKDNHAGPITVQNAQRFKNYWLLSEAGEVQLRDDPKKVLDYLFNKFGKGFVCDNGVDYNDNGGLPEKEGFARAAILTAPKRFYKEGDKWKVEAGEIKPVHDYIPRKGFPILTNDGDFNPETGFPFETDTKREVAEKSYTRKGVSPEVARKAVSKFWPRNEGEGVAAVVAYCYDGSDSGLFYLKAHVDPGSWIDGIERLATDINKYVHFDISKRPVGASKGVLKFSGRCPIKYICNVEGQDARLDRNPLTLGDEVALWNAYQMQKLGKFKPTEDQKAVFDYLFERLGSTRLVDTVVDLAGREEGGFRSTRVITRPSGYVFGRRYGERELGNLPVLGKQSKDEDVCLPRSGFVRLTNDGAYHPSGFPFDTTQTRAEAEQSWVDKGFTPEFASFAVSYFKSGSRSQTKAITVGFCTDRVLGSLGRFYINSDTSLENSGISNLTRPDYW